MYIILVFKAESSASLLQSSVFRNHSAYYYQS